MGDADDETGETIRGGVRLLLDVCIGFIGGLLRFDGSSALFGKNDSCDASDGDGRF